MVVLNVYWNYYTTFVSAFISFESYTNFFMKIATGGIFTIEGRYYRTK